jgi:hypothetical protein
MTRLLIPAFTEEKLLYLAVEGVILEVTGGTREKSTRGLNFAVIFSAPDVSDAERRDYVAAILAERN